MMYSIYFQILGLEYHLQINVLEYLNPTILASSPRPFKRLCVFLKFQMDSKCNSIYSKKTTRRSFISLTVLWMVDECIYSTSSH